MQNIPKIIHYCWFGGNEKPNSVLEIIENWRKMLPDYEIMEWNETNFDVNYCEYSREAYASKKWAFVSDVARLKALVEHGGVYLDTDVEIIKSFDMFLENETFMGREDLDKVATCVIGATKNHPLFIEFLNSYKARKFIKEDGSLDLDTNVKRITELLLKSGLKFTDENQKLDSKIQIYKIEYFSPKNFNTGELRITENTHSIHHFENSWWSDEQKYTDIIFKKVNSKTKNIISMKLSKRIAKTVSILKFRGFSGLMKFLINRKSS